VIARANGIEIAYETLGDPADPPLVLVIGLGLQLIHWPDPLCRRLGGEGFRAIRFDNRDAGRSTHLPGVRYRLEDMADDVAGLLDALGIERAHLAGASLGAMVAQVAAVRHPARVLSLASLMATTGERGKGRTSPWIIRHALARRPRTPEQAVERRVRLYEAFGSPGQDLDEIRRVEALALERDPHQREGRRRQHRAVRAAGDRTAALARITAPTVVIHGGDDRLCHVSGGRATAAAIPGARLLVIDGMGHDLPPFAWPAIAGAIAANARRD
jgi:pimeloyl-ACP methyl ester carboxylesterase